MTNKSGRPRKTGLDWFPFEVGLLTDRKFRVPRAHHGRLAVLAYMAILSLIYADKGYYLRYEGKKREGVELDIADMTLGKEAAEAAEIREVIAELVDNELFDQNLFEKGVLTSKRIQSEYYNAVSRRKCACIDWDIWLLSEDEMREIKPSHEILSAYLKRQSHGDISATLSPINAEKNTQSRVEKSRVEKSREEETLSPADAGACRADARREDLTLYRDYWNRHVAEPTGLPKVREVERWSAARIETLDQRIGREGERGVLDVFDRVARSNYLSGKIADWRADFDWVIADGNFQKIAEGRFDNYKAKDGGSFYDKLARGDL